MSYNFDPLIVEFVKMLSRIRSEILKIGQRQVVAVIKAGKTDYQKTFFSQTDMKINYERLIGQCGW